MTIDAAYLPNNIYALIDPRDDAVRYIGKTKFSIEVRLKSHIKLAKRGKMFPVCKWIRNLLDLHRMPLVKLLEGFCHPDREMYWIDFYVHKGVKLLNCTAGGDGLQHPGDDTRHKLSNTLKTLWASPAMRQRFMEHRIPQAVSAETRAKLSRAGQGRQHTAASIAKMRQPKSPEHRVQAIKGRAKALAEGRGVARGPQHRFAKHPETILRGSRNPSAKLTEDHITEIRLLYMTQQIGTPRLGKQFQVSQGTIWRIVNNLAWSHIPFPATALPAASLPVQLSLPFPS